MMRINRDISVPSERVTIVSKGMYDNAVKAYRSGKKGFSMHDNDLYYNGPEGKYKIVLSKQ